MEVIRLQTKMKSIVVLLLILFSFDSFASPQNLFEEANTFYQKGEYNKAIEGYQSLLNNGNLSVDIYYNLGNCYYKTKNIPASILYYEKALKLQPDNEDALFNLAMANKKTVDKIERLPELFIGSTWKNLVTSKTTSNWSRYCIILLFMSLLLLIVYLFSTQIIVKKSSFYAGIFFLLISLFSFLMAAQHNSILKETAEAIIFEPTVTIKSEPSNNSKKLFTLHEGTKVKILDTIDDWSKIKLPNGNIGFLPSEYLKII